MVESKTDTAISVLRREFQEYGTQQSGVQGEFWKVVGFKDPNYATMMVVEDGHYKHLNRSLKSFLTNQRHRKQVMQSWNNERHLHFIVGDDY